MIKYVYIFILILGFLSCKKSPNNPSFANISVSELAKTKVDHPNLKIIDLRTPTEIANGKIDNDALELNFFNDDFEKQLDALNKEDSYLIYCKSGGRSGKTFSLMEKLGFKEVFHLDGGYKAWSSNN